MGKFKIQPLFIGPVVEILFNSLAQICSMAFESWHIFALVRGTRNNVPLPWFVAHETMSFALVRGTRNNVHLIPIKYAI